jgi:preprotein translocase subunit SecA
MDFQAVKFLYGLVCALIRLTKYCCCPLLLSISVSKDLFRIRSELHVTFGCKKDIITSKGMIEMSQRRQQTAESHPDSMDHHLIQITSLHRQLRFVKDGDLKKQLHFAGRSMGAGPTSYQHKYRVFAAAKEAVKRVTGLELHELQMTAGWWMSEGKIIQMASSEERLLASVLTCTWRALQGRGVHMMSTDNQSSWRDYNVLYPVYTLLGLTVGCNLAGASNEQKQQAYLTDITFGDFREFAADYLHDHLTMNAGERMQTFNACAVIDNAEHVLVHHLLTPITLSEQSGAAGQTAAGAHAEISVHHYMQQYESIAGMTDRIAGEDILLRQAYGLEAVILPASDLRKRSVAEEVIRYRREKASFKASGTDGQPVSGSAESLRTAGLKCLVKRDSRGEERFSRELIRQPGTAEERRMLIQQPDGARLEEEWQYVIEMERIVHTHRQLVYERRDQMWEKANIKHVMSTHVSATITETDTVYREQMWGWLFTIGQDTLEEGHPLLQGNTLDGVELQQAWADIWQSLLKRPAMSKHLLCWSHKYICLLDKHWARYMEGVKELRLQIGQGESFEESMIQAYHDACSDLFQRIKAGWRTEFTDWFLGEALLAFAVGTQEQPLFGSGTT